MDRESGDAGQSTDRQRNYRRRDVLGTLGLAGATALAGCSGGGGGTSPTDTIGGANRTPSGGCPSEPFSYGRHATENPGDAPPYSIEVPDAADPVVVSSTISFSMAEGIVFNSSTSEESTAPSVEAIATDQQDLGYPEVTNQYDLAVPDARVFRVNTEKLNVVVALPTSSGAISVTILGTVGQDRCPTAYRTIGRHVIQTVRPV